jgi:hypothetical protein
VRPAILTGDAARLVERFFRRQTDEGRHLAQQAIRQLPAWDSKPFTESRNTARNRCCGLRPGKVRATHALKENLL